MGIKLWLDDDRRPDSSWTWVKTAAGCIDLLKSGRVTELSLDHDLEPQHYAGELDSRTGYAVVVWLENRVRDDPEFELPHVRVHSWNPVGREHMERGLEAIRSYLRTRYRKEL